MGLFSSGFKIIGEFIINKAKAEEDIDGIVGHAKSAANVLGGAVTTIGKVGLTAIGAVATGIGALTKDAVKSFADYEQLVGGVETLFGSTYATIEEFANATGRTLEDAEFAWERYNTRQEDVLQYASNAFKTAGVSANEYMETVTGFAASLNSSLGEYEHLSASYANMIMTDMADNANKMGTSLDSIKAAYNGFSKGNFTMLDNLKLGYGGTKEEMERLLRKAEELEGYIEGSFSVDSFADISEAIHIVQEDLGIAGTTAKEAGTTISGSFGMAKSAFQNFLTGMANESADPAYFEGLTNNLVESVLTFVDNIVPVIIRTIPTLVDGLSELVQSLIPYLPEIIQQILPALVDGAFQIVATLSSALPDILSNLYPVVLNALQLLLDLLAEKFGFASFDIGQKIEEIKNFFVNTWNAISDFWNGKVVPFWNGTKETASSVADWFSEKFDAISEFVSTNFDKIKAYWDEHLKPCFDAIGNLIKNVLVPAFQWVFQKIIYPTVKQVFDNIVDIWNNRLKPCFDFIVGFLQTVFVGAWNTATTFIKDSWNALKKTFTAIIDFVTNVFSGNWSKAWQNVGQIFGGVFDGIKAKAKLIINSLIDAINGFIGGFNKLKVPDWIPGIGGNGINIPLIPKLEKGGILERGQVGLLEGNGAEAVVPLDQNRKWISAVAQDMNQMSFGSNEQTQRIVELLETLVEIMPDAMKDAVSGMKLNVNNREFARMVKAVE